MNAELHLPNPEHNSHYHGSTYINTTTVYGTLNRVNQIGSASFGGSTNGSVGPSTQTSPVQEAVPWASYLHGPPSAYHGSLPPLLPIADASHTRNRRTSPPDSSCLPGTRKIVLEKIMAWVEDATFVNPEESREHAGSAGAVDEAEDPFFPPHLRQILSEKVPAPLNSQHVLWLCGPVGCGKSAIAQTAAEEFERQGRLAASFFFFRGSPVRSRMSNFAVTLASQMAILVPATRTHVGAALESPAGVQGVPVSTQIRKLVLHPLQAALLHMRSSATDLELERQDLKHSKGKWRARIRHPLRHLRRKGLISLAEQAEETFTLLNKPLVIVIDGVDECTDHDDVMDFIDHILDFFKQNPLFPLRILINSRIEEHIREHIETDQVHVINLSDHAFDQDIEALVRHTFTVAAQRSRVIRSFGGQWPSEFYIRQLVWQAGGSFIFVKTVLNYILGLDASRDDGLTPIDRLKLALKRKTGLDPIYLESLRRVEHIRHASEVVLTIALLKDPVSINNLTHLLSIPAFKIVNVLVPLQAIVRIPGNDTDTITLFHMSLRDYILDASRSTFSSSYMRDEHRARLAHRCIELQVSRWSNRRGPQEDVVEYAAEAWLNLWTGLPQGGEWVRRDLDFLISLGRTVVPNCFVMVFSLFCQGVDTAWRNTNRIHLWSFVDHFPGALHLWHSFPEFKPQFNIMVRALCALAARDPDHLVLELPRVSGSLHHGMADNSLHKCIAIHSMHYILGDAESTWSNYDGPCMTYILLYWVRHLSLAIDDTRSNADLLAFLQEKFNPRSTARNPGTYLTGIQPETDVLSQNLERAISLINKKLPESRIPLTDAKEEVVNHTLIYKEDGLTILDMLSVIYHLRLPYHHPSGISNRRWVMVHIGGGTILEFYSWRPWPISTPAQGAACGDDNSGESSDDSGREEVRSAVDRLEVGFRRYNLYESTDGAQNVQEDMGTRC